MTTVTPAALNEVLALGVLADLQRQLTRRTFVSARVGYAVSDGANRTWRLDHQQFEASLGVGLSASRGVGRVWAQVGGGVAGLYEVLSRQPTAAAVTPGVDIGRGGTSLLFGPQAFGELGVALVFRGAWRGLLAGGPTFTRLRINDEAVWRLGGGVRLGVAYGF